MTLPVRPCPAVFMRERLDPARPQVRQLMMMVKTFATPGW